MMNLSEFQSHINKERKKGGWYTFSGQVFGRNIALKGYETWLQIYKIDGVDCSNPMERKVSEFQLDLLNPFIGVKCLVFDGYTWGKEGDVGDNSKFYVPCMIADIRIHNKDLLVDVIMDNGRTSNSHFLNSTKCLI